MLMGMLTLLVLVSRLSEAHAVLALAMSMSPMCVVSMCMVVTADRFLCSVHLLLLHG